MEIRLLCDHREALVNERTRLPQAPPRTPLPPHPLSVITWHQPHRVHIRRCAYSQYGLLRKNASEHDKFEFWASEVTAVHEQYRRHH
jgi:hypothetical protein